MSDPDRAIFERIAIDPSCAFCTGRENPPALEIDAAYCLTLAELPHREAHAIRHFHEIGLCPYVTVRRAKREKARTGYAIWESHRDVAMRALALGQRRVLVMEDDVVFDRAVARFAPRISRALKVLPQDWWGLYLGHVPVQAYFAARGVLRSRSGALHAYIANEPLLRWYATYPPRSAEVAMWPYLSPAVDSATSLLPKMYALFPMIAFQKDFGDRRIDPVQAADGARRRLLDFDRYRYLVLFYGMRAAEILSVIASPFHWLTMDRFIDRLDRPARDARSVRASGLFDDRYYLRTHPDVAAARVDPLTHYMQFGAREGRRPSADFDPKYYAKQAGLGPEDNPLLHYIRVGRARGLSTRQIGDPRTADHKAAR